MPGFPGKFQVHLVRADTRSRIFKKDNLGIYHEFAKYLMSFWLDSRL